MPIPFAMRQFKAALFESLTYPATIELLKGLSCSRSQPFLLRECFEMTQSADDHPAAELARLLKDPFLRQAMAELGESHAWATLLSKPLRIELLELLCEHDYEESHLIEK